MKLRRNLLVTLALVSILILIAECGIIDLSYSKYVASTSVNEVLSDVHGDCYAKQVSLEVPITRYIPFVKFGDVVERHQYKLSNGGHGFIIRDTTTRGRLWMVGIVSTRKYNSEVEKLVSRTTQKYSSLGIER